MFNTQPLSQRDSAWKNIALGFPDAGQTIGAYGCTLTCVTMIANGFGFNETPASLNEKLRNLGPNQGFQGTLIAWFGIPRALPGLKLNQLVDCRKVAAPMAMIDSALAAGKPVLVELDHSPDSGFQNHWVVLYEKQGSDYLIHDPWPIPTEPSASLMQRYDFAGAAAQVITYVVLLDNPNFTPAPSGPKPTSATVTIVVNNTPDIVSSGGLALRNQPTAAGSAILRRLPAGSPLQSLETASTVSAKIGVYNQWLNVKTADGVTGWCAAWLVTAHFPTVGTKALPTLPGKRGPIALDVNSAVQPPLRDEVLVAVKSKLKSAIIRSKPAASGRIVARVSGGTELQAMESRSAIERRIHNKKRGQWVRVVVNLAVAKGTPVERVAGYIAESNIDLVPPPTTKRRISTRGLPKDLGIAGAVEPDARPVLRVVSDVGLNLRNGPSTSASRITTLPFGSQILSREPLEAIRAKIGVAGSWIAVSTIGGVDGFVTGEFVVLEGAPPTTPTIDPDVLAQGCVFAAVNAPLFNGANGSGGSEWTVTPGTPLILLNTNDWGNIASGNGFIKVRTYAFKEGFVRANALRVPEFPDRRQRITDDPLPSGISAWNYGLHDPFDRNLFAGSNKRGWVLLTHRLTDAQGVNYEDWSKNGWGVIARLNNDYGGSGTIPTPDKYDTFADGCRRWVSNSKGNVIWVIGNEMNNPREWPGSGGDPSKNITPENYAACFNKVRAAIKSVQPNAIVVPGAVDPFQGPQQSCLDYWNRMMAAITDLDGIALHCYTNGPTPDLVTSLKPFDNDPLRWQYFHFRAYSTFMDVVPARFRTKPVFITETDAHSATPWSGGQNGWVQAAYGEINRWNAQPQAQQIQSVILYRWSRDDVYSIVDKPGIQNDIRATLNGTDYRWRA